LGKVEKAAAYAGLWETKRFSGMHSKRKKVQGRLCGGWKKTKNWPSVFATISVKVKGAGVGGN